MCTYNIKNVLACFTLFICMLSGSNYVCAQQLEAGKWIFGNGAGIDFCSGVPVPIEGSKMKTSEGCASISDANGNLLFYTDGITVWNRLHEPMPDGTGLKGHVSSTQSAIIVPLPDNKSIYYIFTMDSEANKGGFCCSAVDMTKQNGLGNVVAKNRILRDACNEKLLAVTHSNGKDIWVLVQEYNSDAFLSYLITRNGVSDQPVISNTGVKYGKSIYNTIGYMKVSANRKKMAIAINGENLVQLFDFDSSSGKVTHPINLKMPAEYNPYGIEFSPDNRLLYISVVKNGTIFQANIEAGDENMIQKSMILVGQSTDKGKFGALQLAVDGKIYIAEYESNYLSSIENPNIHGAGCNYRQHSVGLGRKTMSMFGLPTFYRELIKLMKPTMNLVYKPGKLTTGIHYRLDNVYFDFNKSTLRTESEAELKQLTDFLKQNDSLNISITGHTDSIGSSKYNMNLSLARARSIGIFLQNNGVKSGRIHYAGKGSLEPVAENDNDEGRQKNRRVEFILFGKEKKN